MQWLRWYHGTAADMKFGRIARQTGQTRERVVFVWAMILESASDNEPRGTFDIGHDDIADVLHCDPEDINAIMAAMCDAGMIDVTDDACIVCAWERRQPARDDSATRQRRKRDRDAPSVAPSSDGDANVTRTARDSDAVVTPPDTEQIQNRTEVPPVVPQGGRTKGARLSLEACPDDWAQWARENGHGDPGREFERFRDYWTAQPGQKGVKADWSATWRNWIRRAVEDGKAPVVAEPVKPTGPRRTVAMRFGEGDLSSLRARLRSGMGSAWKVYLETLVPERGGETYGPCPPDEVLADVKKWADYYDIPCEWEVAHGEHECRQLGRVYTHRTTGFWDSSWGPQPEAA